MDKANLNANSTEVAAELGTLEAPTTGGYNPLSEDTEGIADTILLDENGNEILEDDEEGLELLEADDIFDAEEISFADDSGELLAEDGVEEDDDSLYDEDDQLIDEEDEDATESDEA